MSMIIATASAPFSTVAIVNRGWCILLIAAIDVLSNASTATQLMSAILPQSSALAAGAGAGVGPIFNVVVSVRQEARSTEVGIGDNSVDDMRGRLFVSPVLGLTSIGPSLKQQDMTICTTRVGSAFHDGVSFSEVTLADSV